MKEIENDKIFDLLAEKSYQELSNTEQKLVDKELNSSEYESFRDVVKGFKDVDESVQLIATKTKFKKALKKKVWWDYKVPTYQVAAVLVIAILSTFMLTKNNMQQPLEMVQVNNKSIDTIAYLKKSVSMDKEKYPTDFVINW